jgi:heme exporter protein B
MWRDAWLVAERDLRIEARSRVALWQVLPFAVLTLLLFAFALGPKPGLLAESAPGLFWLSVLFSTVLAAQRSIAIEGTAATRDSARLLGLDPSGVFLGKALALLVETVALEVVLLAGVALFFHVSVTSWGVLIASCLLAAVGLCAANVLYGSLAGEARVRATLLPILVLPVVAPVLIAGAKAFSSSVAAGDGGSGARWLGVLAVFAVVYTALGIVLYGPLEEN